MTSSLSPAATRPNERFYLQLYMGVTLAVLLLMLLAGVLMRAAQGTLIDLSPELFYQIMTLHGAGMVGIAGLAGASIMWYFLRRHVSLTPGIFLANFLLFLIGVVMILVSILLGGFGGGWTFLYPLPASSMGLWNTHAAAGFIGGLLVIGVGFLLFYLDAGRALIARYGSLARALGLDQLFSGKVDPDHPPAVVASTMVLIINILGTLAGAVILVMSLLNLYLPAVTVDPLWAKNLIYFFGHVFINATIYMAVIAVYELLPHYTGRPWKVTRPFLAAWAASTIMVMIVYPHHLLMDMVMPAWMLIMGQIISYLSGIPVLLVTAWGTLVQIYRANVNWEAPARFLVLAVFGWSVGVIPAIVDGTITINKVMHNTQWVPGHFHFYLLLGLLPMVLGFMLHVTRDPGNRFPAWLERGVFWLFTGSAIAFVFMFLYSGLQSIPRRFAEHLPAWIPQAQLATLFAVLVLASLATYFLLLLRRLPRLRMQA
ncbi:MAG: cbb3-type cytochrome c oxidase subunit I [Pseudomonadota bacterium]|nr:cbb3-type cytochrome c oxidase subunit I [Pseudomonadota bacterium]